MPDRPPAPASPPGPAAYRAHAGFVAPARGTAELWRTAAGLLVAFVAGIALYQLALALFAAALGDEALRALIDETTYFGDTPRATLIGLFSYVFFATGLAMALQALHGRGLLTLLGPWEAALSDFLRTVLAVGALYLGLAVLLPTDHDLVRNTDMPAGLWLALLPLSLAAIAVQAGTEEMLFRGYIQQQLAARLPGLPVWLLAPAALFAFAHWSPEAAGGNAIYYVIWAFAFGVLAADLTARTGALGAALGLHVANNAFAILGTAMSGPGSGLALWLVPLSPDSPGLGAMMPVELATLVVAWLATRLALKV